MTRLNAAQAFTTAIVLLLCLLLWSARQGRVDHKITAAGLHQGPVAAVGVVASVGAVPTPLPARSRVRRNHPITTRLLDTTAYCWTGNRTASGVWPQLGMAASNLYAFGTRLRVPGIGVVTVTDRIGWGSELDLYLGDAGCEQRALTFGRRSLLVEVLP